MSVVDDLLNALAAAVGGAGVSYTQASAAGDVYEGYIWSALIRAAVLDGATVTYRNVYGAAVNNLIFRTSPGMLYSTSQAYTHAVLTFPNCPVLEAHVGVRVQGKSGVLHECDLLVLPASEADLCRANQVAPRSTRCLMAVECKCYLTSGLGIDLARSFLGLHADLGIRFTYFVANVRASRVERLLSGHNRRWENAVLPGSQQEAYLEAYLREAFKHFQATKSPLATA